MRCLRSHRVLVGSALVFLTACDDRGFSGLNDEWDRRRAGPYYVVSAAPERAVVSAKGRQVAIEPADGFCLAKESVEASRLSAFALIGDCALDTPTNSVPIGAKGEMLLPRGLPGIITVSVSGDPGFQGGDDDDALNGLSQYLETPEGSKLLGRSGQTGPINVVESRRIGQGVYVMVEDQSAGLVPVLDPQFWRAFVELNNRLTVVTVSGFRARPLGREEMLAHLVAQVDKLQFANRVPVNEPGVLVASADLGDDPAGLFSLGGVEPEPLVVTTVEPASETEEVSEAGSIPVPLKRPTPQEEADLEQVLAAATDAMQEDEGTALAPKRSVLPPIAVRPGRTAPTGAEPDSTAAQVETADSSTADNDDGRAVAAGEPANEDEPSSGSISGSEVEVPASQLAAEPAESDEDLTPTRFAPTSAPAAPRRPRRA